MIKKIGLILIIMMLFAGCAMADENNAKDKSSYKVIFLKNYDDSDQSDDSIQIKTVTGTITQGQTVWHTKYLGYYTTVLSTHLNWGDTSDSLSLTIYSPDGDTFGPYYDSDDGSVNGRIDVTLKNTGGIPTGTWSYKIYGQSVSGTQTYSV
jgi:uncharacterized protein YfaP (DUF2135 family)